MLYSQLGRTGLKVSKLCLGTMNFGQWTTEADSFAMMDRALELGINFFDTANTYGKHVGQKGLTETIIGKWLAQGGGRREKVVLATKVYGNMSEGDWPNEGKLSAYNIRKSCEDSLRRLQTHHIDLYQMHHIDRLTPWEEIWQAMEQLVREGKITYVGSSNFAAWNITQANMLAEKKNFLGLVSEQSYYCLETRQIELEVIPCCRNLGVAVLPYSPLGGGLLCGFLKDVKEGRRAWEHVQKPAQKLKPQLEQYETLCNKMGIKPADIALAWVLSNKDVTAPVIGPRTMQQLEENVKALEIALDQETLDKLDKIWPGPGGEAPEAYAW